ncbi:MAG TPA: septum site-determining protein MinD [Anaerolineales bacterium]|jgi:septum site-determining protein MinD|nr:septum site-determining protein MinD [Anaerolineae bacterium]HRJ56279.1 septum site-determining protein MinD [Anaerolineales bacterium]HRK88850.1 septum site-determining protein MinD [Anaerolineales bacterium]
MTAQVITVTSGKGGVGKTTAVANLATALAIDGKRVVCIDGDIGLRNLDVVMGLENRIVYDIVDVIEGRCKLKQAMIRDKHFPEMYLIPAAQTRDKNAVSPSDMVRICNDLRADSDFVIIDSPAGIERGFRNAIAAADRVLVVTNPEVSAVRDADRVVGILEAEEKGNPLLILNRLNPTMVKNNDMLSPEDVLDLLGIQLVGIVPEDETVIIGSNRGAPVVNDPKSRAGQAFRNIAKRLQGQDIPFMDLNQQGGLWSAIQRLAGRK